MRDAPFTMLQRLAAAQDPPDVAFQMDEEAFRLFYTRTARGLGAYLSRLTGDRHLAEDLLQESYYRFLRARRPYENDAHRRHSLFRIATNLAIDARRKPAAMALPDPAESPALRVDDRVADRAAERADVQRALAQLGPRERSLLWLAYAHGASHREIAQVLGLRTGSIKLLLFRARRKMARLLGGES